MKNLTVLIVLFHFIFSCQDESSKELKNNIENENHNTSESCADTLIQEHKIQEYNSTWDTLVLDGIQIKITSIPIGKYAQEENYYKEENQYIIDRYYYSDTKLEISQNGTILLDTLFEKENVETTLDSTFYALCTPWFYKFNGFENGKLIFEGGYIVPDTDWDYLFYHNFDLITKRMSEKQLIWTEINLNQEQADHISKSIDILTDTFNLTRLDSFILHKNQFSTEMDTIYLSKDSKIGIYKVSKDGKRLLSDFESSSILLFKKLFPYSSSFRELTSCEGVKYIIETTYIEGLFIKIYFDGSSFQKFEIKGMINM